MGRHLKIVSSLRDLIAVHAPFRKLKHTVNKVLSLRDLLRQNITFVHCLNEAVTTPKCGNQHPLGRGVKNTKQSIETNKKDGLLRASQ
jgi:hypothetical protein